MQRVATTIDGTCDEDDEAGVTRTDLSSTRLGRYALLYRIGAGAMGEVFAAQDPELGRKVAIKLLKAERVKHKTHRLRLQREAQALARIEHPNVVSVYDVGVHEGQLFITMELVEGETLRDWMGAGGGRPRPWAEVLEVMLAAGEGLAAAHAVELIHRDFKPDNVMVGDDGRVRVMDFGLARAALEPWGSNETELDRSTGTVGKDVLTQASAVLGTLAYMALEQLEGRAVDARSDQFSYCVSFYEALYGVRPFASGTRDELRSSLRTQAAQLPEQAVAVPGWLRLALVRGLQPEPDARWPSMAALLAELHRGAGPRARRGWRGGLAVGVGLLGIGLGLYAQLGLASCSGATKQLEGVWDEVRRAEVEAALEATGLPYAADTFDEVERRLDDYAGTWAAKHTQVCEATNLRHEQSAGLMDLRMDCLSAGLSALEDVVEVLSVVDAGRAEHAITLVSSLPRLERCDTIEARRSELPAPAPELEAAVARERERLARAKSLERVGAYDEGLAQALEVRAAAELLGYAPLVAEARAVQGSLHAELGEFEQATNELEASYLLATELGHERLGLEALTRLIIVVGVENERYEAGLQWAKQAMAMARKIEDEPELVAEINLSSGRVRSAKGDYEPALDDLRQALALRTELFGDEGPELAEVHAELGRVLANLAHLDEALDHLQRALALNERSFGTEHPILIDVLRRIGWVLAQRGDSAGAIAQLERGLALCDRALGPEHPRVAATLETLAMAEGMSGNHEHALSLARRVLAIRQGSYGPEHTSTAEARVRVAADLLFMGRVDEAFVEAAEAVRIFELVLGPDHAKLDGPLLLLANIEMERGQRARGLEHAQRALDLGEAAFGRDHPATEPALSVVGRGMSVLGRPRESVEHYRRALAIAERVHPGHRNVAMIHNNLGLAYVELGELERARTHYGRAREIYAAIFGPAHPEVAKVISNLGGLAKAEGEHGQSLALHLQALEMFEEALGPAHPDLVGVLVSIGRLRAEAGELESAQEDLTRALRLVEANTGGSTHATAAAVRMALAEVALERGEGADARSHAERALALLMASKQPAPASLARARFVLARAQSGGAREQERARELAELALTHYVETGASEAQAQVEAWLRR